MSGLIGESAAAEKLAEVVMRGPIGLLASVITVSTLAAPLRAEALADAQARAVDAAFRQAIVKGDSAAIDRIVAADAKIIHGSNGAIRGKKDLLSEYKGWHINRYERSPVVSQVSSSLAVLISKTRKTSGAHVVNTSTTEVFIRRAGEWKLYLLQNTDQPDA